jgi:transcriptional regulator with XRE-family HTH domain
MNMKSERSKKNTPNVDELLQSLLDFETEEEKLVFEAEMLHLSTMQVVARLMKENNMNKKQLAEALNTSQSFITQLFTGDKLINYKILAKLQRIFKVSFALDAITWQAFDIAEHNQALSECKVISLSDYFNPKNMKDNKEYTDYKISKLPPQPALSNL